MKIGTLSFWHPPLSRFELFSGNMNGENGDQAYQSGESPAVQTDSAPASSMESGDREREMKKSVLVNHAETNGMSERSLSNHVIGNEELRLTDIVKSPVKESGGSSESKPRAPSKSSSSSKDKDRHRDKHKDGHSSSSKHSSSSSSSKHKDGSSSSSSKHRDPSKSSSSSSKDKHSSSSSHKDKDRHKDSSSKDGSREHSSSKHKDGSSIKKEGTSSSSHKDGSSSSSSKHKDKHSSSSSSSKHGEHKSSLDKSKSSSSSSSKDREHKHKDKHKDKDRSSSSKDKDRSSSSKDKDRSSSSHKSSSEKKESSEKPKTDLEKSPTKVKSEPMSPTKIQSPVKVKSEAESDDEIPLSVRKEKVMEVKKEVKREKRPIEDDSDDEPLTARMEKVKKIKKEEKKPAKRKADEDSDYDEKPAKKKKEGKKNKVKEEQTQGKKKKVKKEEEQTVWKWWEEERQDDGTKWQFLEHKGPVFAPEYEPLPDDVKFYYDGKSYKLSEEAEEVAGFYAKMLEHDYTTRDVFNNNFFKDWRKVMTSEERSHIKDFSKCNFKHMHKFFQQQSEERKNRTKEEKKKLKEDNEKIQKEYGFCTIDNHTEKIGNFRIEPPGLFRGRGDHPKQGMLKRRTMPEDVIINCSKNSKYPEAPKGHKWKEIRHDNTVSWLATWTENVQNQNKYVMLNPSSKLKGEKDWMKYEKARKLKKYVDKIRAMYKEDMKAKEMRIRQRAVAVYFIDKLALRAGNEKDEDTADTVGCCSLRVEHLELHKEKDGKECVVDFDFLGKDSIRYQNSVQVDKRVFKNLERFCENKQPGEDVFDRLNTGILNKYLTDQMEGLTAKVFRTYNASKTLQEQLDLLTIAEDGVAAKLLAYNRANRAVAVLCNHQRAVPKNFDKQMENIHAKIKAKKDAIKEAKRAVKDAKSDYKALKTSAKKGVLERKKKMVERLEEQLVKLEVQATDKDENKDIALGTSKLNYLDPRISVAWCKKWEVPVEKIYNKTQREKFAWAIDMATEDYVF